MIISDLQHIETANNSDVQGGSATISAERTCGTIPPKSECSPPYGGNGGCWQFPKPKPITPPSGGGCWQPPKPSTPRPYSPYCY